MAEAKKYAKRATYEDILSAPEHMLAQIVDGELVASPRPASRHANAASVIGIQIGGPFHRPSGGDGGPGGWWILYEPELHFADDVLVPDLAGWRREKMPSLPDVPYFTQAPDWVCEVVSPSTAALDRVQKTAIYAREGVGHIWLVDPVVKTLEAYRLQGGRWLLIAAHSAGAHIRTEPFDAVEIDLSTWWID